MSSEFQPKRIKLEILKSDGGQNNQKMVKLMPFGPQKSKGTEVKVCQILNPSQLSDLHDLDESSRGTSNSGGLITPTLTLRNVSIHQQQQQQQLNKQSNNSAFNTFIKGEPNHDSFQSLFEKESPQRDESPKEADVIALSDDTDSEATEKDLDPQRNFDFIEEASVMDDEIMDDFQDLFQHNINDEQHEKIFNELLNATAGQNASVSDDTTIVAGQSTNFNHNSNSNNNNPPTNNNENSVVSNNNNNNDNNHQSNASSHHDFLINPSSFVPIASKVPDSTHKTASLTSEGRTSCTQPDLTDSQIVTTAGASPSIHTTHSEPFNADILNYLKRIERRLGNIEKRLTKIEEAQNSQNANNSESSDTDDLIDDDMLLSLKFPIKKKHSLEIFENILKVPKMKRSLELKFKQFLGMNESDTIDMILAEMIDSYVQESFKWRQTDTTRSFENYVYINKLVYDCVKHHFKQFSNVEYIRLMSLILNRPSRTSAIQRNFGRKTTLSNFQIENKRKNLEKE